MATQVEVCNGALTHLGVSLIATINENSKPATRLRGVWDLTRDQLLASHRWGFARGKDALAVVSGVEITPWAYTYALPALCLEAREIYQATPDADPIPFTLGVSAAGDARYVLTDEEGAELVYTVRVTTVPLWPAPFIAAVEWALADRVAIPLTGDVKLKQWANLEAAKALAWAKAQDANQHFEDPKRDADWLRARA